MNTDNKKEYEEIVNNAIEHLKQINVINENNLESSLKKINEFVFDETLSQEIVEKRIQMIKLTKGNFLISIIYKGGNEKEYEGIFLGVSAPFFPYKKKYDEIDKLSDNEILILQRNKKLNKDKNIIDTDGKKILDRNLCICNVHGIFPNYEEFSLTLFNKSAIESNIILGKKIKFTGILNNGRISTNNKIEDSNYSDEPFEIDKKNIKICNEINEEVIANNKMIYITAFVGESGKTQSGMTRYPIYTESHENILGMVKEYYEINKILNLEKDKFYLLVIENVRKTNNEDSNLIMCDIIGALEIKDNSLENTTNVVNDFFG